MFLFFTRHFRRWWSMAFTWWKDILKRLCTKFMAQFTNLNKASFDSAQWFLLMGNIYPEDASDQQDYNYYICIRSYRLTVHQETFSFPVYSEAHTILFTHFFWRINSLWITTSFDPTWIVWKEFPLKWLYFQLGKSAVPYRERERERNKIDHSLEYTFQITLCVVNSLAHSCIPVLGVLDNSWLFSVAKIQVAEEQHPELQALLGEKWQVLEGSGHARSRLPINLFILMICVLQWVRISKSTGESWSSHLYLYIYK